MEHHYSIINQCLQLLKQSDLPTIKKLRVEIQLIQMKRLLLNDALTAELMSDSCGEEVFEGLLNQMRRISKGSVEGDALADLMKRIGGALNALGGVQPQHR